MTKIDIISGFLGAGKTTFIKKMIDEAFKGEQIVLIENEFGEVGIDGGFLKDAGIQITEMNSGCICCSLVGDFGKNLNEVITKYHPDRILIEPSGVGKLSDVMKSVIDIEKEQPVKLNALVTVVNALKASKQMKAFGEFFNNQIEYATTVILSRSQNATPEQLEFCVKQIQALNPKASVITTDWDAIKGEQILKTMEGQDNLEMKVLAEARHAQDEAEHHHHHDEHEHHHDHDEHDEHDHEHEHHHDHDEDDDHDGLVGGQGAGNDVEFKERGGEELDDIRAEDGGPDVELAARERVAAKCNSQNRVHFDVLGHNGIVDGGEAADLDKARNGHAQAENDVGQELYELRVDTVEPRGTGVDADCLRIKPDIREPQQRPREYHADHGNENRRRNGHARQEIAVIRKRRIGDHGQFVVIDPCSNGTTGRVENQRGNHRLNFENSNERAVERA